MTIWAQNRPLYSAVKRIYVLITHIINNQEKAWLFDVLDTSFAGAKLVAVGCKSPVAGNVLSVAVRKLVIYSSRMV